MKGSLRRYRLTFGYSIISIIIICMLYVVGNTVFRIQDVEVVGDDLKVFVDTKKISQNLIFFPTQETAKTLLDQNPLIGAIEVKKKYPHTLVIVVSRRHPVACLSSHNVLWEIDKDGVLLGPSASNSCTVYIDIDAPVNQAGMIIKNQSIISALAFISRTEQFIRVSRIHMYDSQSLIADTEKTKIIFAQNMDARSTADTLQTLLSGFRIKGILPKQIDLRFNKPVILYD